MTEPAAPQPPRRVADVRVGSTPDALAPISVASRSLAAGWRQWLGLGVVAGAAVAADQATKQLVGRQLALGDATAQLGPFSIHHVQNSGIAFGLFPTATTLVILLTAAAVAWMLWFFAHSGARHPILPVGLGLVLGGSISNLVDRVRLGHVTDFLDLTFWPAFNLADTFIVVGVVVLLGALVLADREPRRLHSVR
ncbi:MAG: signal peptidase II [Pseudomonadota bacterium]